jgi:hypothetical protein
MLTKQVRELERQADEALANAARVNNRLKVRDLEPGYSAFGGHGDVWSDTAHIYKSGEGNLCGRPALSSNWVAIEQIEYIGCPTCLAKYNS